MNLEDIRNRALERLAQCESNADPLMRPWLEIAQADPLDEAFVRDLQARFPEHIIR